MFGWTHTGDDATWTWAKLGWRRQARYASGDGQAPQPATRPQGTARPPRMMSWNGSAAHHEERTIVNTPAIRLHHPSKAPGLNAAQYQESANDGR